MQDKFSYFYHVNFKEIKDHEKKSNVEHHKVEKRWNYAA
jgi:hypothetical protein